MRKVHDREEKKEKQEKQIMTEIVATNVASQPPKGDRLQRRPLVPMPLLLFCSNIKKIQEIRTTLMVPVLTLFCGHENQPPFPSLF